MRSALSMAAAAMLMLVAGGPTNATQRFDGSWAIYVIGTPGRCEMGYRVPVRVVGGPVYYRGRGFSSRAVGIANSGAVALRLVSGRHVVTANGALKGRHGGGKWLAKSLGCTGRWRAERR